MHYDIQKASLLKRVSAWLLDAILFCVLAVGCMWAVGDLLGYDAKNAELTAHYSRYEAQYEVSFNYEFEEAYQALSPEAKQQYLARVDEAFLALQSDEAAMQTYTLVVNLILLMCSIGILLAKVLLEFVVPLLLRNGQTIGKKVFGLAVMRTNGVRINGISLFIRSVLGKYTVETMLPVFLFIMINTGVLGILGLAMLGILGLAQLIMVFATANHCLIHDKLADTVVVDMASQMIFQSDEDRQAYQLRISAEEAQKKVY